MDATAQGSTGGECGARVSLVLQDTEDGRESVKGPTPSGLKLYKMMQPEMFLEKGWTFQSQATAAFSLDSENRRKELWAPELQRKISGCGVTLTLIWPSSTRKQQPESSPLRPLQHNHITLTGEEVEQQQPEVHPNISK